MFSGQGTQEVGMGRELIEAFKEMERVAKKAENVTNRPIRDIMLRGPKDILDRTSNTQIAVTVISLGLLAIYLNKHRDERPDYVIGHSVGEASAAVAAGAMDEEAALLWVHERGLAMEEEGEKNPGKMAAIIGLKDAIVESIARAHGAHVANYNIPDQQTVISGGIDEVNAASDVAASEGARRVVPLEVTVPAHTPLLAGAVERATRVVNRLDIHDPLTPIAANTAKIIERAVEVRDLLPGQLTLPVKFGESIAGLRERGVTHFREFGHGDVLSGMVKRQFRGEKIITVHAKDDLE